MPVLPSDAMDQEAVDEIKRHFGVAGEQLRSDVRAVAEAVGALRTDVNRRFDEAGREFEETRALIRLSYSELDRRVRTMETEMADLRTRLDRVEERLAG